MVNAKPVLGYPSKTDAVVALKAQKLDWPTIAEAVGTTVVSAKALWQSGKKRGVLPIPPPANPAPDTRGIWTTEKLDRARRLFGKTMLYIAEALEVPPLELMQYGLKGVLPPMGKGQRVAQLLEHDDKEPAGGTGAASIALPAPAGASDRDDEAELAAMADQDEEEIHNADNPVRADVRAAPQTEPEPEAPAAQVASPARIEPGHLYRLTDGAGRYLHESLDGLTANRQFAWRGTTKQLDKVLQQRPNFRTLDPEKVPA
jgi:hypothetical protein